MKYYECCECGGEYKSVCGATFDSMPPAYPVECEKCEKETMAHPLKECLAMHWSMPERLKP